MEVRTAGFEPAISWTRTTRNARLSHVLFIKSAQRELNPRFRLGKAAGCRYIMGAICVCRIVKDREHRAGLEPASPHYGCGILAAGRPVHVMQVGLVGLEPTSTGLRDRCIATSATTPVASRSGRNRTSGLELIRVLL